MTASPLRVSEGDGYPPPHNFLPIDRLNRRLPFVQFQSDFGRQPLLERLDRSRLAIE